MIVKMKKLTILASAKDRESLLINLRNLGTLHIKNITKPAADEINTSEDAITQAREAISALKMASQGHKFNNITCTPPQIPINIKKINSLSTERDDITRELDDINEKIAYFKPWGAFNPEDLELLRKKNLFIRLYRATTPGFNKQKNLHLHIISRDKQYVYFTHISHNPDEILPFIEIKLPQESHETLYKRQSSLKIRAKEIESELKDKARLINCIEAYLPGLEEKHTFLNAMYGMKDEKDFLYMQGFLPIDRVKDITSLAKKQGFGYLLEDPDKPEETPTLIRNPRWINIIKPVFQFMKTIPGYKEYDISPWFLIFFSLFFAMLIGDAGYGMLFAGVTFFAARKFKNAPREPFKLLYLLSATTIVWGTITGTWFGVEEIARLPFLNPLVINGIDSFVSTNQNFMIYLCFIIGVIHLSIAHLIKAASIINSLKALAEIGWIFLLWGLFFIAGTFILGRPLPYLTDKLFIIGASLVILFSNPQKNMLKGILISLADIPLKIIGSFSDVVSYLRLFAVGYASVVMAATFNNMAADLGFNSIATGLASASILFIGHALNILLGLMAVIVHGIRLNMLEFSGQMGMEWSGTEYTPFQRIEK